MGRPREHDAATAEALLDAAEHQLRAGGLESTSLRAVAGEAGVSVRAVYSLFDGKDGLIDGLAIRAFSGLRREIEDIPISAEPDDDLVEAGAVFLRRAVANPELYRLAWERVFTTDLEQRPAWAEEAEASRRALEARIDRSFGEGASSRHDPRMLVPAFHALCQGFASSQVNQVLERMSVTDTDRLLRTTLRAWIAGVRAGSHV